jgi:hypothetical protein
MTTKKPVATLLQTAEVKVVEAPKPAPAVIAPVVESPYLALLDGMPGDPAAKAWLSEQIEVSRHWGEEMLRISSVTLIAILDLANKARGS